MIEGRSNVVLGYEGRSKASFGGLAEWLASLRAMRRLVRAALGDDMDHAGAE